MKAHITVNSQDEFEQIMKDGSYKIACFIVNAILKNLNTKKRFIYVMEIEVLEEDEIYDITVERNEILNSLKENLIHYQNEEDYEGCSKIRDAIIELENKLG